MHGILIKMFHNLWPKLKENVTKFNQLVNNPLNEGFQEFNMIYQESN